MQLDPEKVAYLVHGYHKKLGQLAEPQIKQIGETILERAKPFETLEQFKPLALGRSA
jgi:hypothetical protein